VHKVNEEINVPVDLLSKKELLVQMIWKREDGYPDEAVHQDLHIEYINDEQDGDIAERTIRFTG
jgi:hypothetical protein